jgi:hypothetical protein
MCTGYLPFVTNEFVGSRYIISDPTPDLPDEFQEYDNLFKK